MKEKKNAVATLDLIIRTGASVGGAAGILFIICPYFINILFTIHTFLMNFHKKFTNSGRFIHNFPLRKQNYEQIYQNL